MSHDMHTMESAWLRFWGILSRGLLVGAVLSYPVNWWLVKNGLQPGMSGMKREDRNPTIFAASKLAVTLVTLMMLAGGVALAARYGDLSITLVQDSFSEKATVTGTLFEKTKVLKVDRIEAAPSTSAHPGHAH